MAYNLLYYADFKDDENKSVRIEIYKDGGTGDATELTMYGDTPVEIEYDADDDIFKPLIQSSCTISVVTDAPLLDMYTGKLNEIVVKVIWRGELFWYGFLSPNVYSSDYNNGLNVFQIEFIDCISQLENIKFTDTAIAFQSFLDYINNSLSQIDKFNVITGTVYQNDTDLDLSNVGVLKRNFKDEGGEDSTYREVLESIMMYLGKSMIYYKNQVYIADLTNMLGTTWVKYDKSGNKTTTTVDVSTVKLYDEQRKGKTIVKNASAEISYGDVYNRCTVIANCNKITNAVPELFDDDEFISGMPPNEDYITTVFTSNRNLRDGESVADKTHYLLNGFFVHKSWGVPQYGASTVTKFDGGTNTGYPATVENTPHIVEVPYTYEYNGQTYTSSIKYWYVGETNTNVLHNLLYIETSTYEYIYKAKNGYWWVEVPVDKTTGEELEGQPKPNDIFNPAYTGGVVKTFKWLSGSDPQPLYVSKDNIGMLYGIKGLQKYTSYTQAEGEPAELDWKTCLTCSSTEVLTMTECLNIGNSTPVRYRVNDTTSPEELILSLSFGNQFVGKGGYFIIKMEYFFSTYPVFAQNVFNYPPESYGQVLPYASTSTAATFRDDLFKCKFGIGNMYWNGTSWVNDSTAYFYLTHKNSAGDKVFGTTRKIDNTVSYKLNLADSEEGYGIPLPEGDLLYGNITLALYADRIIGGTAQVPNSGHYIVNWGDSGWGCYDGTIQNSSPVTAIHITKFEINYTTSSTVKNIYNLEEYDPDVKYTNIIDNLYVTDMDDIELTTNSWTSHAVSYSYVIRKNGSRLSYVDTVNGEKQEHRILKKNVDYYSKPKLRYSNTVKADSIGFFNSLYVPTLNKRFAIFGMTIDLKANEANIKSTEV